MSIYHANGLAGFFSDMGAEVAIASVVPIVAVVVSQMEAAAASQQLGKGLPKHVQSFAREAAGLLLVYPLGLGLTAARATGRSTAHCLGDAVEHGGVPSLFTGLPMAVAGIIVYRGAFAAFSLAARSALGMEATDSAGSLLAPAAIASTVAAGMVSYPMLVAVKRMQLDAALPPKDRRYKSSLECIQDVVTEDGGATVAWRAAEAALLGLASALLLTLARNGAAAIAARMREDAP